MKVLHIIPSVALVRGGPSQAILQMVNALNHQGIFVEIATTNDNGPEILDVPLNDLIEYQNVPIRFFSRFTPLNHALREFAFSSDLTQWLWANVRNYDLVHVHAIFSYPSTVAMAIARLRHVPYIVRPLGQLCQWSLQQSQQKKKLYLQLIEQANLNHAQAIHFTSQAECHEAQSLGLTPQSTVIPHGLTIHAPLSDARTELRRFLKLPANEPVILFLSRLHPKKGLEVLINALARIKDQRFTFVVAGSGDPEYELRIRQLLETQGLSDRTQMVGFVQGTTKELLLQGADIFALTSHSENFGVVVLEALAAGLPAIVTPGVALSQLIEDQQLGYVPQLNELEITEALAKCLNTPTETQEIGDRARHFIFEHYTWDKIAIHLAHTYQAILNHQPLPQSYV